jgi:hypothetical protein
MHARVPSSVSSVPGHLCVRRLITILERLIAALHVNPPPPITAQGLMLTRSGTAGAFSFASVAPGGFAKDPDARSGVPTLELK